jgi:GNAT superfamily N-acetyltransferase
MYAFSTCAALPSDCAECATLFVEQLREHRIHVGVEALTRTLERVVTDSQFGFVQLARAEERIVGVAYVAMILSLEHAGPAAWLEELYVLPACRERGIGTALLAAILERARTVGIIAVDLEVDANHSRAVALYERFGFHRLDRSRWVKELTN